MTKRTTKTTKASLSRRFKVRKRQSTRQEPIADDERGWWVYDGDTPEFGPYEVKREAEDARQGQIAFHLEQANESAADERECIEELPDGTEVIPISSEEVMADGPPKSRAKPKTKSVPEADENGVAWARTSRGVRGTIHGYPLTAVIRRFGVEGVVKAEAVRIFESLGLPVSHATVQIQLQAGKKGQRGEPAGLTKKQVKELRSLAC